MREDMASLSARDMFPKCPVSELSNERDWLQEAYDRTDIYAARKSELREVDGFERRRRTRR